MNRALVLKVVALMTSALALACGDSPSSPSGPEPLLQLVGPALVVPAGATTITALLNDGRNNVKDVSTQAQWDSSAPGVLRSVSGGTFVGVSQGTAVVTARYERLVRSQTVLVLAEGTSRLEGRVVHADSNAQRVSGAVVEVLTGIGAGQRATTDSSGYFALYGVAGGIQLTFTAVGYESRTLDFVVGDPNQSTVFPMLPSDGRTGILSGRWTLTLQPPSCPFLPEAARQRQYSIDAAHSASRVLLRLSAPTATAADVFGNFINGTLSLLFAHVPGNFDDFPWYAVLDVFQPPGRLGIRGGARMSSDGPDSLTGTFDGAFDYYPGAIESGSMTACVGTGQAMMRRQQISSQQ